MSGFPRRANRAAFGPTYEEARPVTDPTKEVGKATFNLLFWQVAGISLVVPRAVLTGTVSGGVVTTVTQGLAWDPNGGISKISFTYEAAGRYSFAFSQNYNDQNGNSRSLDLIGGKAAAMNTDSLFHAVVKLTSAYGGEVRIFNSAGTLADPPAFILELW